MLDTFDPQEWPIDKKRTSATGLFFPDTDYEVVQEVLLYDGKALVADVGGYLGLLLGVGAVELLDFVLDWAKKIKAMCDGRRKKKARLTLP